MALSGPQKKLILLVLAFACVSSSGAEAWSWSWSNGSGWGWGSDGSRSSSSGPGSGPRWGSDGSEYSGSGSGSNSDGSGWGWGWGWGSDGSSSSGSGSGTNPDGSGWRWSWGSNHNDVSNSGSVSDSEAPSSSASVSESDAPSGSVSNRKIVVGGPDGWTKGLDYKEWASKNAPFYIDDVLVFKYDKSAKRRNNVYLFQDPWSYMNCNIKNAKKIALTNKGSEESFKFTLNKLQPYFFASGEHDGDYCSNHNMKFTVFPIPHPSD